MNVGHLQRVQASLDHHGPKVGENLVRVVIHIGFGAPRAEILIATIKKLPRLSFLTWGELSVETRRPRTGSAGSWFCRHLACTSSDSWWFQARPPPPWSRVFGRGKHTPTRPGKLRKSVVSSWSTWLTKKSPEWPLLYLWYIFITW